MKKIFAILAVLIISIASFSTVTAELSATKAINPYKTFTTKTTEEERDKIFAKEMAKLMNQIEEANNTRGPKYKYMTEYPDYQYKYVSGAAGNQLPGGYQFPTGGGFYYSDNGGPSASYGISLSLPAPYNWISFSVGLGNSSSSGRFVTVPNTTDFFKLYVTKYMEIRPYIVYYKRVGAAHNNDPWEVYTAGGVTFQINESAYAVKVN